MIERFEQYRKQKKLFSGNDRILLAVSGGIDSMVMLDIFIRLNYNIAVAHCNFQLRGKESDGDEEFVENLCNTKGIKLYKKKFRTEEYAAEKGISIQMAARDLRFDWLSRIKEEENFNLLAMGHNLNDSIETILINLTRGTGINGLTGISPKSGYIIRPLLFATRQMIREYGINNSIEYREDSSNIKTKYTRNKIRHNVIPVLQQINPSVLYSIDETSDYLKSAYIIYEQAIESKRQEIIKYQGKTVTIKTSSLKELKPLETWVYELFKEWNFGKQQLGDIVHLIDGETGKQIFSNSHSLTKNRDEIIITPLNTGQQKLIIINSADEFRNSFLIDSYEIMPRKDINISNDLSYAYLDADLIRFPLYIRRWKEGDYFYPLGMQGRKKVSDLLIDMKIPLPEKDIIYVLEMDGKIVWVIGLRIDDRFKVTESCEEVLVIHKKEA
ncbi:MAG: tRNA lysidine(34) synthetase TilS [Bacteroidales bacterium]|nr:tRNA lysidine(34) synthetase TilS [Bacteroidales bacterium]